MILLAGIAVVAALGVFIWAVMEADREDAIAKGYERENEEPEGYTWHGGWK